ncbi:MAG: DegT/DnrJ/EryC1/StrS family aminotransferase [Eubacterium sp.]|nr:DegT/DnrJ/EryC1/StrS family aminotransferase [Eubacterium sp.]
MINVTQSSIPPFDEYCNEIKEIWDTKWLTNMGVKHNQLQSELEAYLSVPNVSLFTNGHLALENILEAFNFAKGSEIITTPFTFASTTHAVVRSGCKPVFCDIKYDDYTIDETKIEELITDKTVAILPVHVYGNVCNVDVIQRIADKYSLKVIYDAAHAFGVTYKGRGAASFGDASILSFHATKVFNTIEGGAVCFSDSRLAQVLKDIKNFGIHGPESTLYVGGNAKMNEFQAAMGICNLRHIDDEIAKRKLVYNRYIDNLKDIDGVKLNYISDDIVSNYAYFPVVFDNYKYSRDDVFDKLNSHNIFARKYFYPLTNDFECYQGNHDFNSEKTPIAKHISECVLCLPMFADLNFEEIDFICDIIKDTA